MLNERLPDTVRTVTAFEVFAIIGAAAQASKEVFDFLSRATDGVDEPVAKEIRAVLVNPSASLDALRSIRDRALIAGNAEFAEKISVVIKSLETDGAQ